MKNRYYNLVFLTFILIAVTSCLNQLPNRFSQVRFSYLHMSEGSFIRYPNTILVYPEKLHDKIYLKSLYGEIFYTGVDFSYGTEKYGIDTIYMYALKHNKRDTVFIRSYVVFNDHRMPEFKINKDICGEDTLNISQIAHNNDSLDLGVYFKDVLNSEYSQLSSFKLIQIRGDSIVYHYGTFSFGPTTREYCDKNRKNVNELYRKYNIVKSEYLSSDIVKSICNRMHKGDILLFYDIKYHYFLNSDKEKPTKAAEFFIK